MHNIIIWSSPVKTVRNNNIAFVHILGIPNFSGAPLILILAFACYTVPGRYRTRRNTSLASGGAIKSRRVWTADFLTSWTTTGERAVWRIPPEWRYLEHLQYVSRIKRPFTRRCFCFRFLLSVPVFRKLNSVYRVRENKNMVFFYLFIEK